MNNVEKLLEKSIDVTGAEYCEIRIRDDGTVIWVNVDGICVCRICRIENLSVVDDRRKEEK